MALGFILCTTVRKDILPSAGRGHSKMPQHFSDLEQILLCNVYFTERLRVIKV